MRPAERTKDILTSKCGRADHRRTDDEEGGRKEFRKEERRKKERKKERKEPEDCHRPRVSHYSK